MAKFSTADDPVAALADTDSIWIAVSKANVKPVTSTTAARTINNADPLRTRFRRAILFGNDFEAISLATQKVYIAITHKQANTASMRFMTGKKKARPRAWRNQGGFSLVEVIVAIAIFAFCLVSIMGVLGSGLVNLHSSIQNSSFSRIGEQVLVNLEQSTFSDLTATATAPTVTYYDGDGNLLPTLTHAVYQATYTVTTPAQLPPSLPSANLIKVTVTVSRYANTINQATYVGYIAQ